MPQQRPACGGGGSPIEGDSRPRGTLPNGGIGALGECPGPCGARSCTLSPPRVDQRPSALRGRGDSRGASLGDPATVSAADAAARLRRGRPRRLGGRGECLWGPPGAADVARSTPPRPCLSRLGESIWLACRSATPGHKPRGDLGGGGLGPVKRWRRDARSPLG